MVEYHDLLQHYHGTVILTVNRGTAPLVWQPCTAEAREPSPGQGTASQSSTCGYGQGVIHTLNDVNCFKFIIIKGGLGGMERCQEEEEEEEQKVMEEVKEIKEEEEEED